MEIFDILMSFDHHSDSFKFIQKGFYVVTNELLFTLSLNKQ